MTATLEFVNTTDTDRAIFAKEFNALLETFEVVRIPAVVLPGRDFSDFTI